MRHLQQKWLLEFSFAKLELFLKIFKTLDIFQLESLYSVFRSDFMVSDIESIWIWE